jgi:hypothetical protein
LPVSLRARPVGVESGLLAWNHRGDVGHWRIAGLSGRGCRGGGGRNSLLPSTERAAHLSRVELAVSHQAERAVCSSGRTARGLVPFFLRACHPEG